MYYLDTKQIVGKPLVIIAEPDGICKTNYAYWMAHKDDFKGHLTFYLKDRIKPPYEAGNLVFYDNKEEKPVNYNYYNCQYEVATDGGKDGVSNSTVTRKWLDTKVRCKVVFPQPTKVEVWDKEQKKNVEKEINFAKLDLSIALFEQIDNATLMKQNTFKNDFDKDISFDEAISKILVTISVDNPEIPKDYYKVTLGSAPKELPKFEDDAPVSNVLTEAPTSPFLEVPSDDLEAEAELAEQKGKEISDLPPVIDRTPPRVDEVDISNVGV